MLSIVLEAEDMSVNKAKLLACEVYILGWGTDRFLKSGCPKGYEKW